MDLTPLIIKRLREACLEWDVVLLLIAAYRLGVQAGEKWRLSNGA